MKRRFQKSQDLRGCGAVRAPLALWELLKHNNWATGEWSTQHDLGKTDLGTDVKDNSDYCDLLSNDYGTGTVPSPERQ